MGITTASRHDGGKQIPTRGYRLLKGQTEQNLGGVLKIGSGLGPNQWLNRWLSVTIASIQSLKKVGCTPLGRVYSSLFLEEKSRRRFSFDVLIL